ncbi:MAG TPA: hypothetical protein VG501_11675 [Rhizomicrobium sp.]|nr:hypothetical protein [Rhizomicrobium sp.]
MKNVIGRIVAFVAAAFFLAAASAGTANALTFTGANLKGNYSFMLNVWNPDPGVQQGAILGVVTFDGVNNVSANFTSVYGSAAGPTTATDGSLSGTYVVNSDGTGTVSFTGGVTIAFEAGGTAAGLSHDMVLYQTGGFADGSVRTGTAVLQSVTPKVYRTANLKGNFPFVESKWTANPASGAGGGIGMLSFDGKGHVTITGGVKGTYSLNADGRGTISYYTGPTYSFAINGNSKGIIAVLTSAPDYTGNTVITLTGFKQ